MEKIEKTIEIDLEHQEKEVKEETEEEERLHLVVLLNQVYLE